MWLSNVSLLILLWGLTLGKFQFQTLLGLARHRDNKIIWGFTGTVSAVQFAFQNASEKYYLWACFIKILEDYLGAYRNCIYSAVYFPEYFRKILLVTLLHKNTSSKINSVEQEFFKQYLAVGMVSGREEQAGSCSLEYAYCQRGSNAYFVLLNNMNPFVE